MKSPQESSGNEEFDSFAEQVANPEDAIDALLTKGDVSISRVLEFEVKEIVPALEKYIPDSLLHCSLCDKRCAHISFKIRKKIFQRLAKLSKRLGSQLKYARQSWKRGIEDDYAANIAAYETLREMALLYCISEPFEAEEDDEDDSFFNLFQLDTPE